MRRKLCFLCSPLTPAFVFFMVVISCSFFYSTIYKLFYVAFRYKNNLSSIGRSYNYFAQSLNNTLITNALLANVFKNLDPTLLDFNALLLLSLRSWRTFSMLRWITKKHGSRRRSLSGVTESFLRHTNYNYCNKRLNFHIFGIK